MATFRIQKNKDNPYVMLNKEFLNDKRLSWKAKGILAYLLSLPDDWKINEEEISTHSKDGIKATSSGIKELINCGYIHRKQLRENGKFKGYEHCVYEVPTETPKSENGKSENGKQELRKSHTTNNKRTNNKKTNNDSTKSSERKSNFNNFEQREYDFDSLEKRLLGWDK